MGGEERIALAYERGTALHDPAVGNLAAMMTRRMARNGMDNVSVEVIIMAAAELCADGYEAGRHQVLTEDGWMCEVYLPEPPAVFEQLGLFS